MCDFEEKVKKNLIQCGIDFSGKMCGAQKKEVLCNFSESKKNPACNQPLRLGAAVSGGADSISLLLALSNILRSQNPVSSSLYVITVNHNIRPAAESRGDVDFVLEVCEKLKSEGHFIECEVVEFSQGQVFEEAEKRGGGIEEAARYLRYAAFEKFIAEKNLDALCLAHNINDQLETLLMRFLQGSSCEAAGGIRCRREKYIRPLLNIERREIEAYVARRVFSWRTDKTNYETDYLRNRIRLKLVPFLNDEFPGWQKAVLSGAEKMQEESDLINSLTSSSSFFNLKDNCVEITLEKFLSVPDALKYHVLLDACNKTGEFSRIPRQFLKDVINSIYSCESSDFTKHFSNIDIKKKKNKLLIKKHNKDNTDFVFFDIIEEKGEYEFPFGVLSVYNIEENGKKASVSVKGDFCNNKISSAEKIGLPFCVRSIQLDDTILCADGSEKKVSDIISDWHIPKEMRKFIPVLQVLNEKSQQIKCIFAGFLGYKDWIVKL